MVYKSIEDVGSSYDVVVIGSGLGGLTLANRLAGVDHKVLLLEHHHQLGGLATWFKRKGHIFDISLHGFPFGMVKTCKKYWNRAIMESIVQLKKFVFPDRVILTASPADIVKSFPTHPGGGNGRRRAGAGRSGGL